LSLTPGTSTTVSAKSAAISTPQYLPRFVPRATLGKGYCEKFCSFIPGTESGFVKYGAPARIEK
jgi:hypothetical protein